MALTRCGDCNHKISTKAKACPKCGAAINITASEEKRIVKQKKNWDLFVALSLLLFAVLIFVYAGDKDDKNRTASSTRREKSFNRKNTTLSKSGREHSDRIRYADFLQRLMDVEVGKGFVHVEAEGEDGRRLLITGVAVNRSFVREVLRGLGSVTMTGSRRGRVRARAPRERGFKNIRIITTKGKTWNLNVE